MTVLNLPRPAIGRAAVLALIKREGPVAADDLARSIGLTGVAVRQHLQALSREGLVVGDDVGRAGGRGRPARLWRTTPAADARFSDAHAALTADLIGQVRGLFGEDGLERLLRRRTDAQECAYLAAMDPTAPLAARLGQLAAVREREGYMAEVRADGDSGWLLLEHHCPICAAARICSGLCREELELFGRVLGPDVRVERVSHVLAGAGRCAYRVTAA